MNDTSSLHFNDTSIENGTAVLTWVNDSVNWSRGSDFSANGVLGPTLSASPSGIELGADNRNHIADGNFSAPGPWQNATTQNVSVVEESSRQDAYLGHTSNASDQVIFDSLDTPNDPNWTSTSSVGSTCLLEWVPNGTGSMIRCTITLDSTSGSWAGIALTAANWSSYDRLVFWMFADDVFPLSWSFEMTAMVGSTPHNTSQQPLSPGAHEMIVNLTELGPNRGALTNIRFLVVGASITGKEVLFDNIRLTTEKSFNETGRLWQNFTKSTATSSSPGSATLAFDYQVAENSGVVGSDFVVNFSGNGGFYSRAIPVTSPGSWTHYFGDVSSFTQAIGSYSLEFALRVAVETFASSRAVIRIDNVTVLFPNRAGGSFVSRAIDVVSRSQFVGASWYGAVPSETSLAARIRTGNENDTNGPNWGTWQAWTGRISSWPGQGPSHFLQIGFDLSTNNASRTPLVSAVQMDLRHRTPIGSIEPRESYRVITDSFLRWGLIRVQASTPVGSELSLFANGGSGWEQVPPGGGVPQATSTAMSWSVRMESDNGTKTPELSSVVLTYEIRGSNDLASILLSPYGLAALIAVAGVGGYSSYVAMSRRAFAVDDLFLISREGRLMMHNTRRMRPDRDEDILSGMMTAILAFVRDSDPEGNGELRHFKVGDKTTMLERGQHSYVAAVYSGRVPRWAGKDLRRFVHDLEGRFGSSFANWSGDPDDLQGLKEFTSRFVSHARYRTPRNANGRAN